MLMGDAIPLAGPQPASGASYQVPGTPPGAIVVASDGTEASLPALTFAKLLAARGGELRVVSVLEPPPPVQAPVEESVYWPELEALRRRQLLERVHDQASIALGKGVHAVELRAGSAAEEIAEAAGELHAGVVITGRRHHGRLERLLASGETPLAIARSSRAPVLVVPSEVRRLPRVAVVAMDFDDASVHAAWVARPLVAGAERVYVVHVREVAPPPEELRVVGFERYFAELLRTTGDQVVAALGLPPAVPVEVKLIVGHPVEQLLDFAERVSAELIVIGHRKRPLLDRLTTRSVAERVFRAATCPVLLVPERGSPARRSALDETPSAATWSARLETFAAANRGRLVRLDLEATDGGEQAQVHGYALKEIAFAPGGDSLRITLAGAGEDAPSIEHAIPHPVSLEFRHARGGADRALRIAHARGSTLLNFIDRHATA